MWERKDLKSKAKVVFKKSYWKMVLVSLILALVSGGFGSGSSYNFSEGFGRGSQAAIESPNEIKNDIGNESNQIDTQKGSSEYMSTAMIAGMIVGIAVVFLVVFAVVLLLSIFILNPFIVGIRRFFAKEMKESTKVKEIAFAFDHSYSNITKIMFMRDLYTFLWTLLLIIPGIVKGYEYRMIPYILGDNPSISKEDAFLLSKEMMNGQKWHTFVLDLSFIGWNILSLFTLGILSIFYVEPYMNLTKAELYNTLSGNNKDTFKYVSITQIEV